MSKYGYRTFIRDIIKSELSVGRYISPSPADPLDICQYVDDGFINIADSTDAVRKIERCLDSHAGFKFFTINLDHLSKLKRYPSFRDLYQKATFVSADGWPVAVLAGRKNRPISRTTGADLIFPVCALAAKTREPVFLFGSTEQVLTKAEATLKVQYPGLTVVGKLAPPFNFDPISDFARECAERISESGARLCFVALGAPTQEAFADFAISICPRTGFLCVGAALDFVAGAQHRAPKFMQNLGLEWAWRWALSPRRLSRRYLQCACVLAEISYIRCRKTLAL